MSNLYKSVVSEFKKIFQSDVITKGFENLNDYEYICLSNFENKYCLITILKDSKEEELEVSFFNSYNDDIKSIQKASVYEDTTFVISDVETCITLLKALSN